MKKYKIATKDKIIAIECPDECCIEAVIALLNGLNYSAEIYELKEKEYILLRSVVAL